MTEGYIPDRGDIVWMVLDPVKGHEQAGRRPVLILSDKRFNERTSLAVICPITSRAKGLPFEVTLTTESTKGVVLPIHVRSVGWQTRKLVYIESASPITIVSVIDKVNEIIKN